MRDQRNPLEEYYAKIFLNYVHEAIDGLAVEDTSVTDQPDMVIQSNSKRIGVELTQIPSSYIIQHFHASKPTPCYKHNQIVGDLFVFPFEPHRWVHEALEKKSKNVEEYKKRVCATDIWLLVHCHSDSKEWPMSEGYKHSSRKVEKLLMHFGTKVFGANFDKIFYVYADGAVVELETKPNSSPSKVSIGKEGEGYPAVTSHRFSFSADIPSHDEEPVVYVFNGISFQEHVIQPIDDWMRSREPNIARPIYDAKLIIEATRASVWIMRNGEQVLENHYQIEGKPGEIYTFWCEVEWSIQNTSLNYS